MIRIRSTAIAALLARGLLLGGLVLAAGACSSSTPLSSYDGSANDLTTASTPDKGAAAVGPASHQASQEVSRLFDEYSVPDQESTPADYRLAPMDVVDVAVFEAPNLSRTAQVSAAGYITLPLIADVKASGKTTDQLQRDIAQKLQQDFMQSPQVFVSVKEYNSQRVTVDGAVKNPGIFPLKGETTLIQVLASAGGLNEMAAPSGIYILRKTDGKKMAARFDLREIRSGKKDDPVMRAGDIVIVDESGGKIAFKGLRDAMGFTGLFRLLLI